MSLFQDKQKQNEDINSKEYRRQKLFNFLINDKHESEGLSAEESYVDKLRIEQLTKEDYVKLAYITL